MKMYECKGSTGGKPLIFGTGALIFSLLKNQGGDFLSGKYSGKSI